MVENMGIGNNSEIRDALKAFNQSSVADQQRRNLQSAPTSNTPNMVQVVIKYSGGLIKNEEQADYLVFVLAFLSLIVSFHLFFKSGQVERTNLVDIKKIDQSQFVR
jgi:hypothetical protein